MRESVHAWLSGLVAPREGQRVADLGCGRGSTLVELANRWSGATLVGLDLKLEALRGAHRALRGARARGGTVLADLAGRLPFSSSSLDTVLCHDVLECIPGAEGFLEEVARILKPGGRLLLSHHDFDALVFVTADRDLNRRIVHAYADAIPRYMPKGVSDGLMGRRLPGLVRQSPLTFIRAHVHVTVDTEFSEGSPGWNRATEIAHTLVAPSTVLREPGASLDVERWLADLRARAAAGAFFFSEPVFAVEAAREPSRKPPYKDA